MKKILILLLMVIPLACSGQARHARGEIVGAADNTVVDSLDLVNGMLTPYVGGSAEGFYNDSIEVLQDALDLAEARIAVLEGADVTAPYPDSAYILPGNDTTIYVLFDKGFDENATFTVDAAFAYTYGATSYTAGTVD